ncbi:hypothetical protein RSOLAG22IIIB_01214 [Rhizoctonia solani]|uniref:Large ribosomal subunit protein uL14m n=2 Tax=Rhizoctonia solani TaxID=456999 RepID=A0A0K6G5F3_9AGAM|nr:hypothetical protein RSOLAG22IIIB_01214 [Rhizoctonia solani]
MTYHDIGCLSSSRLVSSRLNATLIAGLDHTHIRGVNVLTQQGRLSCIPNSYSTTNPESIMLGLKATLNIIDNSGALLAECVNVLKSKSTGTGMAKVGDEIVVVIRRARPISATALASATAIKVRKGDVRRAVVVRTKKEVMRPDGRYIRFDDNAGVLLNNKKELLGTRINGVVSADLRMKGWSKIASLAPKVV